MNQKLKILHLEDLLSDSDMVNRELKKAGIDFEKVLVENRADYIRCLKEFHPDIILSDHSLPSFDSQEALKTMKEMGMKMPFILVTATVSEEYAVNIMKEGASDYILKDRLQRLPNAVLSAIEKFDLEKKRLEADEILRSSERKYKLLFLSNPMPMWMVSRATMAIIDVNEAAVNHYGYSKEEFLALHANDLIAEEGTGARSGLTAQQEAAGYSSGVWKHRKKDGTPISVDILTHDIMYEEQPSKLILANDVTEKLQAEAELARHRALQQKLLAETSIQAQEKVREEIGKELHDNINQILSSTKLYLESSVVEKDEKMLGELLQKSIHNLGTAIQEIRQLSHRLVAPSLGNISLEQAIQELIVNITKVTPMKLNFSGQNFDEELLDKNVKLMCYRIVQEQINNILKHSHAKRGIIQLATEDDKTVLTIKDDGVGFDTSRSFYGIGLRNIANRAELYNGDIAVLSAPGKGCTLEVHFPVARKTLT